MKLDEVLAWVRACDDHEGLLKIVEAAESRRWKLIHADPHGAGQGTRDVMKPANEGLPGQP